MWCHIRISAHVPSSHDPYYQHGTPLYPPLHLNTIRYRTAWTPLYPLPDTIRYCVDALYPPPPPPHPTPYATAWTPLYPPLIPYATAYLLFNLFYIASTVDLYSGCLRDKNPQATWVRFESTTSCLHVASADVYWNCQTSGTPSLRHVVCFLIKCRYKTKWRESQRSLSTGDTWWYIPTLIIPTCL